MVDQTVLRRKLTTLDEYLQVLWQEGILDEPLMERLKKMAQFRNLLVHDYRGSKPEIVHSALMKDSLDIESFVGRILAYLPDAVL